MNPAKKKKTEPWALSGAPMPLNAELKFHFHASKRSQTQETLNFWQIRSRNKDRQEKASFTLLKPPGCSKEAAGMVHLGYFRLTTNLDFKALFWNTTVRNCRQHWTALRRYSGPFRLRFPNLLHFQHGMPIKAKSLTCILKPRTKQLKSMHPLGNTCSILGPPLLQ